MNTLRELDDAVKAMPLWKQIAWAFELIHIPELDEADRRLSNEYYDAVEGLEDYDKL